MNKTRLAILGIVMSAVIAGFAMYYLQVYAFYDRLPDQAQTEIALTTFGGEVREAMPVENFSAIDSDSSPLRYRACFETAQSLAFLSETFAPYDAAIPLTGPAWFDCFDAQEIGEALETGEALPFLLEENFRYGFDKVVAVFSDGRGVIWHQLNHCGEMVFDGEPAPENCPPAPEGVN